MGLAAHVWLDEIVLAAMQNPKLYPTPTDLKRAGEEVTEAHALFTKRGWIADPASYHLAPPVPEVRLDRGRGGALPSEVLTFPSGYAPHAKEPGRDRWLALPGSGTALATLARSPRPGRPWVICIHGFGMGTPSMDARAFRASRLRDQHDVNLLFPVLPAHGKRRAPGKGPGEGFTSVNVLDGIHGLSQAVWEVRSLVSWIRQQDPDARIGVYGISLGACVAALVASLEADLAFALAAIPVSDFFELSRRMSPLLLQQQSLATGAMGEKADELGSVVTPLRMTPKLPPSALWIAAGTGDRMTSPEQATKLWEHWGRPGIEWYPGGHVGYFMTRKLISFLDESVSTSLS